MSIHSVRPCPCGSGKDSYWQLDARGIPLRRTCDDCHDEKMKGVRPDVLTDGNYWTDEEVEPEPEVGRPEYGSQLWAETYSDDLGESPDY